MEIRSIHAFIKHFEGHRRRTLNLIRCIPPDQIEWTYRSGKFTLGDQIRHIAAIERYLFAEVIHNGKPAYSGCGCHLAEGYDDVIAFMERCHHETVAILQSLNDDQLQHNVTAMNDSLITIDRWLQALIEHEVHHRGEMYVYLGLLGVQTPPLYGITAEDIERKSYHDQR